MFVVTMENGGMELWLKRTIWTSFKPTADQFNTEEEARAAAKKAEKFMDPKIRRSYKVVPV